MVSKKAKEIPPFIVMDVLEKAQELERMGGTCHSSGSGGARFRHPGMHQRGGLQGHLRRKDPLHAQSGIDRAERGGL